MMLKSYWYNFLGNRHVKKAKKFPPNTVGSMYHYGLARLNYKLALDIAKSESEKLKRLKGWLQSWEK